MVFLEKKKKNNTLADSLLKVTKTNLLAALEKPTATGKKRCLIKEHEIYVWKISLIEMAGFFRYLASSCLEP